VEQPLLARLLHCTTAGHEFRASLHPAAAPLVFTWAQRGPLEVEAKTSGAGPGYHAFAYALLARLAARCGWRWNWRDTGVPSGADPEDAAVLQAEFLAQLRSLAEVLAAAASEAEHSCILDLPLCSPMPVERAFSFSHTGAGERSWWTGALALDDSGLTERARDFHAWWNLGCDGLVHVGLARTLLLWEFPWREPLDARERIVGEVAETALRRAAELGLPPPEFAGAEDELAEILARGETPLRPPAADGPGFRRREMAYQFIDGWQLEAPGWLCQELKPDEACLSVPGRCIRLTIMTMPPGLSGLLAASAAESDEGEEGEEGARVGLVPHSDQPGAPRATFGDVVLDDGPCWLLRARLTGPNSLAVLSIYGDARDDRDWAIRTFRSLRRPV
jgi:hypothetical protein